MCDSARAAPYMGLLEGKLTALAMSSHARLGSSAPINCLTGDILKIIAKQCCLTLVEKMADNQVRLSREYFVEDSGVFLEFSRNEQADLCGAIFGPIDTPYSGGVFFVDIRLGNDFPFKPPKLQFRERIWHPSIHPHTGDVALFDPSDWTPGARIPHLLLILRTWLTDPPLHSVLNPEAHRQRTTSWSDFERKAREWTRRFAT